MKNEVRVLHLVVLVRFSVVSYYWRIEVQAACCEGDTQVLEISIDRSIALSSWDLKGEIFFGCGCWLEILNKAEWGLLIGHPPLPAMHHLAPRSTSLNFSFLFLFFC